MNYFSDETYSVQYTESSRSSRRIIKELGCKTSYHFASSQES